MDEGQLFDISSYHEPKEGRVAPSRPASLDSYIQRCAEAETRPNDSRQVTFWKLKMLELTSRNPKKKLTLSSWRVNIHFLQ